MLTVLEKMFVKKEMSIAEQRERYGMLCGIMGILLNILLFGFKLFAGFVRGSISIMADAFNNLSDAGSSVVTLIGFKLAGQKPDLKHPYGHGRVEYLIAFIVSASILAMGFGLLRDSVDKLLHPSGIQSSTLILLILFVSILVKCYMVFYNFKIGNKINSEALKATGKDSLSDSVATLAVLFSTYISFYKGINIDAYCGCLVSVFILYAGFSSIKEAIDPLLGTAPDEEYIKKIEELVVDFDEQIVGIHDLMIHDYGPARRIISLHAEVPADGDIMELHDIIDNMEIQLRQELGCLATIHMDPIATNDPLVLELKEKVANLVLSIHEGISIHDFRMVQGNTHTNLIFDMAVPFACGYSNDEIEELAQKQIQEQMGKQYFAVIEIDRGGYISVN